MHSELSDRGSATASWSANSSSQAWCSTQPQGQAPVCHTNRKTANREIQTVIVPSEPCQAGLILRALRDSCCLWKFAHHVPDFHTFPFLWLRRGITRRAGMDPWDPINAGHDKVYAIGFF